MWGFFSVCQFFITKVRKNHTSCMSFLREILSKITVFIQIEDNSDHIKKSFCMGVLICIIYLFKLRIIFFYFQKLSLHHLFLFCLFERGTSRIFFHISKSSVPYFPNCYIFLDILLTGRK